MAPYQLCALTKEALRRNMRFNRIMTNGAWFKTKSELNKCLERLYECGYDGEICASVDAFHRQSLKKVALFIETAVDIFKRPDIVSVAVARGAMDDKSHKILRALAHLLKGRIRFCSKKNAYIKRDGLFIKIFYINLSMAGIASGIKDPWNGKWFKDDLCKGPGNVFFVLSDGTVKPCCGYANDSDILTIGSIKKDAPGRLVANARKNLFIRYAFGRGLHFIRKRLQDNGARFPGKTSDHCFFCGYITTPPTRWD